MKSVLDRHGLREHGPRDDVPPRLHALVLDRKRNFLEVSIGSDDGVRPGQVLDFADGPAYQGRAVIRRTDPERSVAEIIPEFRKGDIEAGDSGVLVVAAGGTNASESAVSLVLKWIASRQSRTDGGWHFDHNKPDNIPDCPNPGTLDARNGATALALLPFLGAGQTHKEGSYKQEIRAGLTYLIRNMKVKDNTGSLEDDVQDARGIQSHAQAALVLCEAYSMTHDKELLAPAQLSLNYLVARQDPMTGGWPKGNKQQDTLTAVWCVMALKAGHMAYPQVPKGTVTAATKFLDARLNEQTGSFGRFDRMQDDTATAGGSLARMYLGWKRDHPPLVRGVKLLRAKGPQQDDALFNFLATNVMFHLQGAAWADWNAKMREQLIRAQTSKGVAKGSWYLGGENSKWGGRLYDTALTAATLEVYYRHLPLYRAYRE